MVTRIMLAVFPNLLLTLPAVAIVAPGTLLKVLALGSVPMAMNLVPEVLVWMIVAKL